MKECVCCQCVDGEIGYEPDYYQCEACNLYGTEDDFTKDETCDGCHEAASKETK